MKKTTISIFALSAMAVSTSFAWDAQVTNFFFGNKDEEATSQSWSLISNWSTEGNNASAYPSVIPGTSTDDDINGSHKVVFRPDSNKNGGQYVKGVTDVLDVDMDVKIHQIQVNNIANSITNVRAVEDGSLTFLPGLQTTATKQTLHASIIMDNNNDDFRVGSDFSVCSAKNINGQAANPFFWQRASKNLYLGAADGMSTITIKAYEGTSSTGEFQFHFRGSGNIVVNGKLTTNVYKDAEKTTKLTAMVFIKKNGDANAYGNTVFQAAQTNDVDTITVAQGLTAVFDMKNGAKAVAEKNTRANNGVMVAFRENSTIRFDGNNQLQTTTVIAPKFQTGALSAGLIDLNNTSQEAGMLRVWMTTNSNSGKFALDFGDEKNTANTLKLHDSFSVLFTDYTTSEAPIFDPTTSEFLIKNFEQGKDQFLVKNKISDDVLSAVYFEGLGTKGVDYEVVQNQLANGFWSLSYNAIPEPSTYAGILGALAIAFAFMRRQPRK